MSKWQFNHNKIIKNDNNTVASQSAQKSVSTYSSVSGSYTQKLYWTGGLIYSSLTVKFSLNWRHYLVGHRLRDTLSQKKVISDRMSVNVDIISDQSTEKGVKYLPLADPVNFQTLVSTKLNLKLN